MDIKSESVAEPVSEVLSEVFFGQYVSGVLVDCLSVGAWLEQLAAFDFCTEDLVVDFFMPLGRFSDDERACDIGAVSVEACSAIDGNEVAGLKFSFTSPSVGFGRIWATDDDGLEGEIGPVASVEEFDFEVDIEFGDADLHEPLGVGEAGIGELARCSNFLNFVGSFDHSKAREEIVGSVRPIDLGKVDLSFFARGDGCCCFKRDGFCPCFFEGLVENFGPGCWCAEREDLQIGDFVVGLDGVAGVGDEEGFSGGDECYSGGSGESGEPLDIETVGEKEGGDRLFGHGLAESFEVAHFECLRTSAVVLCLDF